MGIEQYKIDSFKKPVSALADTPQMSADELKAWFDSNTTDELKTSVNGIVDAVLDMEADAAGVVEALDGKVDKELGKGLSENDYTDEEKQKVESTAASLTALEHNTTLIQNSGGGFAAGTDAEADTGAALGRKAWTGDGGAAGYLAYAANGGGSAGKNANSNAGGAVGADAKAGAGFAGGKSAKAVDSNNNGIDAIQLGTGTNNTPKTLQAYGYQLMDANGKIPDARLNDAPRDGNVYARKDSVWKNIFNNINQIIKPTFDSETEKENTDLDNLPQGITVVEYMDEPTIGGYMVLTPDKIDAATAYSHQFRLGYPGAQRRMYYAGEWGEWRDITHTHENKAILDATEVAYTSDEQARINTLEHDLNNLYTDFNVLQSEAVTDAPSDGNTYARKDGAWEKMTNLTSRQNSQLINFVPLEYNGSDVTDLDNLPNGITIVSYMDGPGAGGYMVMTALETVSGLGYQIKMSVSGISFRFSNGGGSWAEWKNIG